MSGHRRKLLKNTLFVFVFISPVLFLMLFPYFIMITTSLRELSECIVFPPKWFPSKFIWRNYIDMFKKIPLARFFLNSTIVASGATLLCLMLAIPAAFIMTRYRMRGNSVFLFLILITQMFAPAIMIIAIFKMVLRTNTVNTFFGLIITDAAFVLPFSIWLLRGFFKSIPNSIFEAATIDGASDIKTILRIALPITKPGIVTALVFAFIQTWNEFIFAMTFLTSYDKRVLTIGIFAFSGRYEVVWNYLLGSAFLSTIPVLVLFLIVEKYIARGLTAGAVK